MPDLYSTAGENSAFHAFVSSETQIMLGVEISSEPDGQPYPYESDRGDEGIGFTLVSDLEEIPFEIQVTGAVPKQGAVVGVWFDWNESGMFEEDEFSVYRVIQGINPVILNVPSHFRGRATFARFRLFDESYLPNETINWTDFEGPTTNGEVEDYLFGLPTSVTVGSFSMSRTSSFTTLLWFGLILTITLCLKIRGYNC